MVKEFRLWSSQVKVNGEEDFDEDEFNKEYRGKVVYFVSSKVTPNKYKMQNVRYGLPFRIEGIERDNPSLVTIKGEPIDLSEVGDSKEIKQDLKSLKIKENYDLKEFKSSVNSEIWLYIETDVSGLRNAYNQLIGSVFKKVENLIKNDLKSLRNRIDNDIVDISGFNQSIIDLMNDTE